jgi:hypothetical protein
MYECKTSGFCRIMRVVWESLCPYEVRWGIEKEEGPLNSEGSRAEFGRLAQAGGPIAGPRTNSVRSGGVILPHAHRDR